MFQLYTVALLFLLIVFTVYTSKHAVRIWRSWSRFRQQKRKLLEAKQLTKNRLALRHAQSHDQRPTHYR